jgi:hypothetical protein
MEEAVVIRDVEADGPRESRVVGEALLERPLLFGVHRENQVGPVEHPLADLHEGVLARARRADLQVDPLAEQPLGRRAARAVQLADEQHTAGFCR